MLRLELLGAEPSLRFADLYRTKVPGGWLILIEQRDGCGATFVPDPQHKWNGKSLP
jgi:hypothetical protein